ncbi:SPASM domain-containing protein [Desulfovibrio aminophilus]|uniref:SPASM domain-containing protein n=1 Tax=Desulfovibrio aminophilus TaxID=81425 RepID=UPI0033922D49
MDKSMRRDSDQLINKLSNLWAKICNKGYQPFVTVVKTDANGSDTVMQCNTQNDAPAFVHTLVEMSYTSWHPFVAAIDQGLRLEVYNAAQILFDWIVTSESGISVQVFCNEKQAKQYILAAYIGYPIVVIGNGFEKTADFSARLDAVSFFILQYVSSKGNDVLRIALVEAFTLGFCRGAGHFGKYKEALSLLNRVNKIIPNSIFLKAAESALNSIVNGEEVPLRLKKFIGHDNGYLKNFICQEPFRRFDVGPCGDVLLCCGHWLPRSIGNFERDDILSILNSPLALKIRKSVTDGTYKYCNHLECSALIQEYLPSRETVKDKLILHALETGDFTVPHLDNLMFAYDRSCNLSCPSCRNERYIVSGDAAKLMTKSVRERLIPLLRHVRVLNLNPAGELFASKSCRNIMRALESKECSHIKLDIISNGTLFSERVWARFPGIHDKIRSVRISTDSCTKSGFEKLRRGANWEIFLQNITFLSELRRKGVIPQLKFSFTYQRDNFREIPSFVDFCTSFGADFVIFERLQNLGTFTQEQFCERAVHRPDHPLHAEFLAIISDKRLSDIRTWNDFDYHGYKTIDRDTATKRLEGAEKAKAS